MKKHNRISYLWLLALSILQGLAAQTAFATLIVNTSDRTVYVARAKYYEGHSSPDYVAPGWSFSGWTVLEPGESLNSSTNILRVEQDGKNGTWNWPSIQDKIWGVYSDRRFNMHLPFRNIYQIDYEDVKDIQGHRPGFYRVFQKGKLYEVEGDAYRIATKRFHFNEKSRSRKSLSNTFNVPGKVIDYKLVLTNNRWSHVYWNIDSGKRAVSYNGSQEGRQVRPFGPREHAFYEGYVDVRYTRPR